MVTGLRSLRFHERRIEAPHNLMTIYQGNYKKWDNGYVWHFSIFQF